MIMNPNIEGIHTFIVFIFLVLKYIAWALKISLRAFTVLSSIIRDINLRILQIQRETFSNLIGIILKIRFCIKDKSK